MALPHAQPGEPVDLRPLGDQIADARTQALVKSERFEAVRLVVPTGREIPTHSVPGEITIYCIEGRVRLGGKTASELSAGEWIYLEGGAPHSVEALEDSSLLLTILFAKS